mgnify:CR=1 FL=1
MEMEEIFFSGTFAGELLSLAAAKSVLEMHKQNKVAKTLTAIGEELNGEIEKVIFQCNMQNVLSLSGHSTWKFLVWHEQANYSVNTLKTYFMQEIFKRGLLLLGTQVYKTNDPLTFGSISEIETFTRNNKIF